MLIINDVLIDEDIFLQNFVCDLSSCKGRCCIEGDLGAPLEANELDLLEKYYPKVKRYLSEENRKAVEQQGFALWTMLATSIRRLPKMANVHTSRTGTAYSNAPTNVLTSMVKFRGASPPRVIYIPSVWARPALQDPQI
jgi:Protein of unknown function (DUF3109).